MYLDTLEEISKIKVPKSLRPKCGARCRDGHQCRAPVVWDKENNRPVNGRCRMHGGLSTGPRTVAGRLRSLQNLRQYKNKPIEQIPVNISLLTS